MEGGASDNKKDQSSKPLDLYFKPEFSYTVVSWRQNLMTIDTLDGKWWTGFIYEKNCCGWNLCDTRVDAQLRKILGKELAGMERIKLPAIPADRRPWIHQKMLLQMLGKLELDGGRLHEIYGSRNGRDTYTVAIEINKRLSSYRAG
jgi:hypothetical protein